MSTMKTLTHQQIQTFRSDGQLMVREVFDADEILELRTYYNQVLALAARADLNPVYYQAADCEVHIHLQAPNGVAGPGRIKYLRKVQWPSMFHAGFEKFRLSQKLLAIVEPLLGNTLKQYINQINFKMPGGGIQFPWHQDVRPTPAFRDQVNNYVQTIIAVDDATIENGCLFIVPESHKLGDLKLKRYVRGEVEKHVDVNQAVPCLAQAGDVILFTSYTVHGSMPNRTNCPRRSYINGFVRAESCDVGKWAFLDGRAVPITSDYDYADIRITGSN